jgi:3-oxoacyl-[acyl-carrier protein] reductase
MTDRPIAIVTGARRGIGLAVAEALAAGGFDLCLTGTTPPDDGASRLCSDLARRHGGRAIYMAGDIGDLASHAPLVERAVAEFGRIDCLVNNAGMGAVVRGDVLDLRPENFDRVIAVNLRGTIFLTQAVVRWMLAHPAGDQPRSIVHVTSVSAELVSPERLDYCISKAGLAMWSKGLAVRLAPEGIGVFDVRPGIIRTDMTSGVADRYDRLIEGGLVPMRRWGEGADIGRVVAALAGGAFAFATGSVLQADGGLSIHRL